MNETKNIKILKKIQRKAIRIAIKDLPHGYKVEIANRSGLSYRTVLRFFEGKTENKKLHKVFGEYLSDYVTETKEMIKNAGINIPRNDRYEEVKKILDSMDD